MANEEGDLLLVAEVGQPVPAEQALAANNDVGAKRSDGSEESVGTARQAAVENDVASAVKDAQMQL
jgi:hypothetical protein